MTSEIKEIDINQIIEIVTPFDKFEHEPLLDEIQGNILKSHGRNHAVYLFLKFEGDIQVAKQWIGSFTHRYVTSALEQAEQRKLPFKFYLQNQVGLGESSAYDDNIKTLNKYIEDVINQESDACEYKIAELEEYNGLNWAIGLNGDTLQPDGFVNFFGERELPFKFFVQSQRVSLGDKSAYDQNIKTLNDYISSLNRKVPSTVGRF